MLADMVIATTSTEYVNVPVQATVGGQPYNPTADNVAFAFIPGSAQPGPSSWNTATWITTVQGMYVAQCLVGPQNGGIVLAPGTYTVWVMITDNPEVPVLPAGSLAIT